ncbi:hypothetical protein UPYG_G00264480 [Umbra pygmaea]|uniref:Protein FAM169B n=1 Tax=Umbra pygmaea TaxID=75934 RepID=A0ABD0W9Y4_UMBPY
MESNKTTRTGNPGEFKEMYPVDLPDVDYNSLSSTCENIMSSLESNTYQGVHWFVLSDGSKVAVTHNNVGRLQLFGDDPPCTLLALHMPVDETQVLALNLHGKWWPLNDVLKTSNKSRTGLVMVTSVMERLILSLLSQIIFGVLERSLEEDIYFSPHPMREFGKILWHNGEAVGFYTIKKKGSLCDGCTSQTYQLPVLDTVFVRTQWRRRGLALQILADFCASLQKEEEIGLSYPITPSMIKVCKKFLVMNPELRDQLYEVEGPGAWGQRRNIWLNIQLNHSAHSEVLPRLGSGCNKPKVA